MSVGRSRTFRARTKTGSKDAALTRRSSGCRSTMSRFTYQSPRAVSDATAICDTGNMRCSLRVGRITTIAVHEPKRRNASSDAPGRRVLYGSISRLFRPGEYLCDQALALLNYKATVVINQGHGDHRHDRPASNLEMPLRVR